MALIFLIQILVHNVKLCIFFLINKQNGYQFFFIKYFAVAKIRLSELAFNNKTEIIKNWEKSYPIRRHEALNGSLSFGDWNVLANYEDVSELVFSFIFN